MSQEKSTKLLREWTGYFDGACIGGNKHEPGPTQSGGILYLGDEEIQIFTRDAGTGTVNTAEYHGLITLLEEALEYKAQNLTVYGDSQLVIYQMQGRYKVKNPRLKTLHRKAKLLAADIPGIVQYEWIPRSKNTVADRLSKQ